MGLEYIYLHFSWIVYGFHIGKNMQHTNWSYGITSGAPQGAHGRSLRITTSASNVGGFFTNPSEKYCLLASQIGFILPKFSWVENKTKNIKPASTYSYTPTKFNTASEKLPSQKGECSLPTLIFLQGASSFNLQAAYYLPIWLYKYVVVYGRGVL